MRAEIPYQVIGGTKFYERAEIKDAIAYLTVLINPQDVGAFTRIVNALARLKRGELGPIAAIERSVNHRRGTDVSADGRRTLTGHRNSRPNCAGGVSCLHHQIQEQTGSHVHRDAGSHLSRESRSGGRHFIAPRQKIRRCIEARFVCSDCPGNPRCGIDQRDFYVGYRSLCAVCHRAGQ